MDDKKILYDFAQYGAKNKALQAKSPALAGLGGQHQKGACLSWRAILSEARKYFEQK